MTVTSAVGSILGVAIGPAFSGRRQPRRSPARLVDASAPNVLTPFRKAAVRCMQVDSRYARVRYVSAIRCGMPGKSARASPVECTLRALRGPVEGTQQRAG